MAVFITVSEGENPATATPVLATRDPRVAGAIAKALGLMLEPPSDGPSQSKGRSPR